MHGGHKIFGQMPWQETLETRDPATQVVWTLQEAFRGSTALGILQSDFSQFLLNHCWFRAARILLVCSAWERALETCPFWATLRGGRRLLRQNKACQPFLTLTDIYEHCYTLGRILGVFTGPLAIASNFSANSFQMRWRTMVSSSSTIMQNQDMWEKLKMWCVLVTVCYNHQWCEQVSSLRITKNICVWASNWNSSWVLLKVGS